MKWNVKTMKEWWWRMRKLRRKMRTISTSDPDVRVKQTQSSVMWTRNISCTCGIWFKNLNDTRLYRGLWRESTSLTQNDESSHTQNTTLPRCSFHRTSGVNLHLQCANIGNWKPRGIKWLCVRTAIQTTEHDAQQGHNGMFERPTYPITCAQMGVG